MDMATNEELASFMTEPSDASASRDGQRKFQQRELEIFGPKPD